jgi:hypothetical protein
MANWRATSDWGEPESFVGMDAAACSGTGDIDLFNANSVSVAHKLG